MREWEEDIFRVPSYLFQSKSHAERGGFSRASEIPAVFKEKFEDLKNPKQKDIWLPGFLKKGYDTGKGLQGGSRLAFS